MTTFKKSINVKKSLADTYVFLADFNNHQVLMPENIENWESTADEARFTIKNMAKLALAINERVVNQKVTCSPIEKAPIDIKLSWNVEEVSSEETKATFSIDANLNMMMKMVASGPLQKLVDYQVAKLEEVLG